MEATPEQKAWTAGYDAALGDIARWTSAAVAPPPGERIPAGPEAPDLAAVDRLTAAKAKEFKEELYEIRLRPPAAVADPDVLAVCVTVRTVFQDVAVAKAKAALGPRWTGRDGATVKAVRTL
jgi:hypothetical protein